MKQNHFVLVLGLMVASFTGCVSYNAKTSGAPKEFSTIREKRSRPAVVYLVSQKYVSVNSRYMSADVRYKRYYDAQEELSDQIKAKIGEKNIIHVYSWEEMAKCCRLFGNQADYFIVEHRLSQTGDGGAIDKAYPIISLFTVLLSPIRISESFHVQWNLFRFNAESGLTDYTDTIEYDVRNIQWVSLFSPLGLFFPGGRKPYAYMPDVYSQIAPKCYEHLLAASIGESGLACPAKDGKASLKVMNSLTVRIFREYYDPKKAYVIVARRTLSVNNSSWLAVKPGTHEFNISHLTFTDGSINIIYSGTTMRSEIKPGHLYVVNCNSDTTQYSFTEVGQMDQVAPVLYAYLMEVR